MNKVDMVAYFSVGRINHDGKELDKSFCAYEFGDKSTELNDTHPDKTLVVIQLEQILYLVETIEDRVVHSLFSKVVVLRDLDESVYLALSGNQSSPEAQAVVSMIINKANELSLTLRIYK
ncbi:hypothetical protein [Vibrio phage Va2]|nr:hypothetical protein [Vibrio phage Va2]